ncbi:MAG: RNA 2',3'-cyclic phosphodiesterase [Methylobacter sp.]
MSRLFFALWPDDETRHTLVRINKALKAKGLKPTQPENLHVTLVFLGQVDKDTELQIKELVHTVVARPFQLTFDNLSHWSRPQILCLTCQQSTPVEAINLVSDLSKIAAGCGLQMDTRPYTPHITLARHARYLSELIIEPLVWCAEAFCLVESCSESGGVCYKVRQQWPLLKPDANPC